MLCLQSTFATERWTRLPTRSGDVDNVLSPIPAYRLTLAKSVVTIVPCCSSCSNAIFTSLCLPPCCSLWADCIYFGVVPWNHSQFEILWHLRGKPRRMWKSVLHSCPRRMARARGAEISNRKIFLPTISSSRGFQRRQVVEMGWYRLCGRL
jgi:hypothetical protein